MTDPAHPMFANPIAPWHRWFAWRPVRCWDGRWAWLRPVERRLCQMHYYLTPHGLDHYWQYQLP